jgi:hypothetical protein
MCDLDVLVVQLKRVIYSQVQTMLEDAIYWKRRLTSSLVQGVDRWKENPFLNS